MPYPPVVRVLTRGALGQVNQWIDVCSRHEVARMEILDRLSANLGELTFLAGHRVTVADYLMYFLVHPLVVCAPPPSPLLLPPSLPHPARRLLRPLPLATLRVDVLGHPLPRRPC
jgi:hypothetical protein